jgi:hypothetical protein
MIMSENWKGGFWVKKCNPTGSNSPTIAFLTGPKTPQHLRTFSNIKIHVDHASPSLRGTTNSHMTAAIPERRPATEQISGVIERVIFHTADSVLRIKAKGHREETTVIGSLPAHPPAPAFAPANVFGYTYYRALGSPS